MSRETVLYPPLKHFLEHLGYEVKSEIQDCDIVAVKADHQHPTILECKMQFNLSVVLQAVERLSISPSVYICVPAHLPVFRSSRKERAVIRLCRMLGIGLIRVDLSTSHPGFVETVCEPEPYEPRRNARKSARLMTEFAARIGDFNEGGSSQKKLMTAYRQKSLLVAHTLLSLEHATPVQIKKACAIDNTQAILSRNVYEWFTRVEKGIYGLSDKGRQALIDYADMLEFLLHHQPDQTP
ncbi:DUF2161 family putative PD-(D/E)XK-type phosphodiesterase [Marinicrinis sediminis]|uniref:DUF2161 family putative PD-(D/E)XK-type phosphodiesterase n=1 Tax=Marinicrinis sediminis TaxID=1652465 RepID=A0ABW5R8Y4_9BACL